MGPRLLAAAIGLGWLMYLLFRARKMVFTSWFLVAAWRHLSGEAYHGRPMTDAGWLRAGTKALTPTGHAHSWWHRPRWQRALHRTGVTAALGLFLAGLLTHRTLTLGVVVAVMAALVLLAGWRLAVWFGAWGHRRTWLLPLHHAAHDVANWPKAKRAASWITYDLAAKKVTLDLPQGWPADEKDKQRLASIVTSKLGIENPVASWRLAGPSPRLVIEQSAPVPALVKFDDVRPAIEAARPGQVVLGLGQGGKPVVRSQLSDSPHWGLSAESGSGKSVTARTVISQHLHNGGIVAILDAPKRFSHQWCKGLPNVAYARTAEEAAKLLHWLRTEADRRNAVADVAADLEGNVKVPFLHVLFVVEEANALMKRIRAWWKQDGGDGTPPAIDDLGELVMVGRQVRYNGLFIGQRLSSRATGDGDIRENLGVLVLMNPSPAAWKMLASRFPMPPADNTRGRGQVISDKVEECQVVWMTAVEAREHAMSGRVAVCPDDMPCRIVSGPSLALSAGSDQQFVSKTLPVVSVPPDQVTLSEAVRLGIAPVSLYAARKRTQRDEVHPRPVGRRGVADLYDSLALADYYEANP